MERLSRLVSLEVMQKRWKPIRLTRKGPEISHLFFADDLVLFAEASLEQVEVVNSVLNVFCGILGQKVNANKTRVFSPRMSIILKLDRLVVNLNFVSRLTWGSILEPLFIMDGFQGILITLS